MTPRSSGPAAARAPVQTRSRKTMERILRATEGLLEEQRFEEIVISEIVRAARTSVGSFYNLFPTKESLLPQLLAKYSEELSADIRRFEETDEWEGVSLQPRARVLVEHAFAWSRRRRGLLRTLFLRYRFQGDSVPTEFARQNADTIDVRDRFLLACRDEMTHPDPESAVRLGLHAVYGVIVDVLLFPKSTVSRSITMSHGRLVDELTRMLLSYLLVPAGLVTG